MMQSYRSTSTTMSRHLSTTAAVTTTKNSPFQTISIEFNLATHLIFKYLRKQNYYHVLPDLPIIRLRTEIGENFYNLVPMNRQVLTVAINPHHQKSFTRYVKDMTSQDHICIVKGNGPKQTAKGISTKVAITMVQQLTAAHHIWAVCNPNWHHSWAPVNAKSRLGVTRFLTQPLLSSKCMDTFQRYQTPDSVKFHIGICFPSNLKDLEFWMKLQDVPTLRNDPLMKQHLEYFRNEGDPVNWALAQTETAEQLQQEYPNKIVGVHYMPMENTSIFLSTLRLRNEAYYDDDIIFRHQ